MYEQVNTSNSKALECALKPDIKVKCTPTSQLWGCKHYVTDSLDILISHSSGSVYLSQRQTLFPARRLH